MGQVISGLRGDIANKMNLRDKAARSVAELELALQQKIDNLELDKNKAK